MRKTRGVVCMILAMMIMCMVPLAQASIRPGYGMGQTGYMAIVLCEKLTVRDTPSTRGKSLTRLSYGTQFVVGAMENGFYECYLSENGPSSGWVLAEYVLVDPSWYVADQATSIYAWNDTGAKKVGLVSSGTELPIIQDMGSWLVVSLRGAAGWIRKTSGDYSITPAGPGGSSYGPGSSGPGASVGSVSYGTPAGPGTTGTTGTVSTGTSIWQGPSTTQAPLTQTYVSASSLGISSVIRAELSIPDGKYTVLTPSSLTWIEQNFSRGAQAYAPSASMKATLTLTKMNGQKVVLSVATDNNRLFRTEDGLTFTYGQDDTAQDTFWGLFGLQKGMYP